MRWCWGMVSSAVMGVQGFLRCTILTYGGCRRTGKDRGRNRVVGRVASRTEAPLGLRSSASTRALKAACCSRVEDAIRSRKLRALHAVKGVDLCAIPTIGVDTVLVLPSEIGPDLSRFPTQGHFCSWLALAPPIHISGGNPCSGKKPKSLA